MLPKNIITMFVIIDSFMMPQGEKNEKQLLCVRLRYQGFMWYLQSSYLVTIIPLFPRPQSGGVSLVFE